MCGCMNEEGFKKIWGKPPPGRTGRIAIKSRSLKPSRILVLLEYEKEYTSWDIRKLVGECVGVSLTQEHLLKLLQQLIIKKQLIMKKGFGEKIYLRCTQLKNLNFDSLRL